jgi:hypothetical protein
MQISLYLPTAMEILEVDPLHYPDDPMLEARLKADRVSLAPVLASCSLFGIYLLLKYFPNLSLQTLLDGYFWLLGTAAITGAARPLLRRGAARARAARHTR